MIWPETKQIQQETIRDLERNKVNWALLQDYAVDGRDNLRLRNSHALLWNYIQEHFVPVYIPDIDKAWQMLVRKDHDPEAAVVATAS